MAARRSAQLALALAARISGVSAMKALRRQRIGWHRKWLSNAENEKK
jgi:hypothetical protein